MLKYLIIAAVFWFNPLISNVDILPDIVGYLLVLKAFSKPSYAYECASEVCISAKKMCIVTGVKFFSIVFVSSFDVTMSLLLSFSFGLIECIFGIPFFIKLFDAIFYLVPVENEWVHKREGKIVRLSIIAFVARLALAVLPDLTALSLNSAFVTTDDFTYLRFRPLFIGFSFIISLIIGIVWLVKAIRLLKRAITRDVVEKCNSDFVTRTTKNKSLVMAKDGIRAVIATAIGSLFIFNFTWEYTSIDIFQDFMFSFVATVALVYLAVRGVYRFDKYFLALLGTLALHVTAGVLEMIANITYFEKYNLQSVLKVSAAEDMYFYVSVTSVFSAVMLAMSSFVVLLIMRKNARENIVKHSKLFSEIDIDFYLKEFDKRTKKHIIIALCITCVTALIYTISVFCKPYAEWMTLLNTVLEIASITSFISASLYVHDEVYKRIATFA